ncbi:hypothetical protein E2320_004344 [Naja naja]|nr:hypothetical protein E2320_004344 [Naja naja]
MYLHIKESQGKLISWLPTESATYSEAKSQFPKKRINPSRKEGQET